MHTAGLSFLIAEDHDFQRGMLARMLGTLGAREIHQAADGHAALSILSDPARKVDIVISDLDMPGMDGMEFIRHLAAAKDQVSIILASALDRQLIASVETMSHAYGIKVLGIVEKPYTPGKLETLIRLHALAPLQHEASEAQRAALELEEIVTGLRNGEFEAFFQPKVALTTGRVKGTEALARWRHPRRGIVSPQAFIEQLEEHGLIDELTWRMLEQAAACCRRWLHAPADATVSVNLSIKSLADVHLAERIIALVRGAGIEPRRMVLEVTESAAATDVGRALENLARLRIAGFGLSIDDYGTGYSSMQQLSRIAFTELKIDRSFVANAARQESSRVILASSLDMARKLGIAAVAEGVETQGDWDLLCELGCDVAQGYFIAKPMAADAFLDWTRNRMQSG